MNANHARPLLAFWLLAIAAAVITSVGLRAPSADIEVRAGSPAPVTGTGSPELVLGGLLHAQPTSAVTNPLSPGLWDSPTTSHAPGTVVDPPTTNTQKTRNPSGSNQVVTVPTQASTSAKTHASATAKGSGKDKHKSDGSAKTTTTATATARPTGSGHGNGNGNGNGQGGGKGKASIDPGNGRSR